MTLSKQERVDGVMDDHDCGVLNHDSAPLISVSTQPNALAERIKELNCLYGISNLLENQGVSLPWILARAVTLIPAALQYPEKACARIKLDGGEYFSANFKQTDWSRKTPIMLHERQVGELEVFYVDEVATGLPELFLNEELHLLRAISERLSRVLGMKLSEEALKESEERYRILMEQVTDGVALVQNQQFCYVNPVFCKMFHLPSAEAVLDRPVDDTAVGDAADILKMYGGDDLQMAEAKTEFVHRLDRPYRTLWIQVCHRPISFKGQPALLSTFSDVTEIKEQQVAAQNLAKQLNDENRLLRSSFKDRYRFGDILGRSPLMQDVFELILKAAVTDASVAIFGESGTGKELVARAIHENSSRRNHRLVAVNCGAVQETLFEREFFGHRKGSFSGAYANAAGYLDMADRGTLFLDEVGELTVAMQAKLLRAIEGGGYRPVGSTKTTVSDFRIISASNVPLSEKVGNGQMRGDFFYRLQVIAIQLPPLCRRKEDIPLLVDHFVHKMSSSSPPPKVPGHVIDRLADYHWPGNVRELRNVIQRYLSLGRIEFLTPQPAPSLLPTPSASSAISARLDMNQAVRQLENSLIAEALHLAGGNRTKAAALLGISRRALFRRLALE
jgi:two-component system, NtrC family, response regulator HydG